MDYKYDISVVVPLFNEAESLPELYAWIKRVMQANGFSFEIIFVNDGSTDSSWQVIESFATDDPHVHASRTPASRASSFAATTARVLPCTADFVQQRDASL